MNWIKRLFGANETKKILPTSTLFVEVGGKSIEVKVKAEQRLLDAMLAAGIDIPFSCEDGVCGSCQCHLITGNVEMKANHFLTDEEVDQGLILACQSLPKSQQIKVKL